MSPQADLVTARLRKTWLQWWTCSFWSGAVLSLVVSLATLLLFVTADALLRLPQRVILPLFAFWVVLSLICVAALLYRQRRGRRSLEATARRVELAFPELESHLINLVQFAGRDGLEDDPFRRAAIAQSAVAVADIPFHQAASRETRWRRFLLCMQTPQDLLEAFFVLALVLGLALLLGALLPTWGSSTRRMLHPFTFVPTRGSVQIVKVTPGDAEVLLGASLEITAEIAHPNRKAYPATLYVRQEGKPESAQPMLADETGGRYVAALSQVLAPLGYRLQIGDSQTPVYQVTTYQKPSVAGVEVAYEFPSYLNRPREVVRQTQGDLEAPQFTRAELKIHPTAPIARGQLVLGDTTIEGQVGDDGKTLHARLLLRDTTTYTIHLFTATGHTDPQPRVNQLKVLSDAPPTVAIVEPAGETTVAVGGKPNIVVRAGDDYGLGEVRIESRIESPGADATPAAVRTEARWTTFAATGAVQSQNLALDAARVKPGQTVWVRAVARDTRNVKLPELELGPQESASPWLPIHLVAAENKAKADLAQLESLRTALARILQDQLRARAETAGLPRSGTDAEAGSHATALRSQQVGIQKASAVLVEAIAATGDADTVDIKRALGKLAFGAMVQAIRQAELLQQVKLLSGFTRPAGELGATQEQIIDVLRRMLGELRREAADVLAELKKRPDTQLPADVQSKLRDLKDKLAEFLKQQKKVIEATENLAKKPVEDFTEKEKQLLKDLAAAEDEWARFMADKHTDLSKLPEQDFSNPSLLKELVEVQTELKMAKDALTKKTADIAVPLEQLGAEMAKEMTTNIEKWLPDTPDRERWSQEEPLTGDMKEAPMAELPREMEDIVGKLMEGEEDLFNEMEDASSTWADSLDKGAGWDAMDGPISNNSARGVTGNRLPNTSEIAGRSGEGRQGKSSGEFVGDTAVGKGGRNTPSRLTPDAFVKGQVKDYSKDPVGGATGGGKESGAGGEGLHGPIPDRPARDMGRLATRQAQLRNKAEGVDLRFKVLKYHHNDLKRMIDVMATVETDLKAGRYQSALRRRDVLLQGLGQVKTYLKGEFTVRQDRTANLPTDVQKEILGSMQEPSPPGWEELNRQYFERLTSAPSGTPASSKPQPEKK